ncbi:MAG: hypothetical protein CMF69_12355 [Magnetovibrio sp.]|nr:hypothetical protein [Magnetovibrio sp.]
MAKSRQYYLNLYSRFPQNVAEFATLQNIPGSIWSANSIEFFGETSSDVIINAVGAGDPSIVRRMDGSIINISAKYDDIVLSYLANNPKSKYIFLSSGAVYGNGFGMSENDFSKLPSLQFLARSASHYSRSKVIAEVKHRQHPTLNIIDIRIFGYFSRFINVSGELFLAEVARAILQGTKFITTSASMIRDYSVPFDLWRCIEACISGSNKNMAVDLRSRSEIEKFYLLRCLKEQFELDYVINDMAESYVRAQPYDVYFSNLAVPPSIYFKPKYSSLAGVISELSQMLNDKNLVRECG